MANENVSSAVASEPRYIVGIGASAGGLEALQKLLSALPPDTGFPYIIVQHLSPEYKSLLGEILGKCTEMPVIPAEDGMVVLPNHVYVIQPGKIMRITGGILRMTPQNTRGLNLPIDTFFRSLAADAGSRAIAIILSGTGSDGSSGIKDIKEHDGMIIAQNAESAKFDGMPRSALRTGMVDAEFTPEEIAKELRHISMAASRTWVMPISDTEIDERVMRKIYVILKKVSDVNFVHYKQSTIMRRVERRMMLCHKESLADYLEYLYESPEEARTLSREVLIGVTSFFRDPDFFQILYENAIVPIVKRASPSEVIRVWVAGCSTGEEAYSIAIMFREAMDKLGLDRQVKIFATDLDREALTTAGKGAYTDAIEGSITPERLSKYFIHNEGTYNIMQSIRKMIVFSPHNVIQDPPFGRIDLISCRNMLIYFQVVLQNDIFALFHQALKDGGFLFLGKSEAIGEYSDAFPVVNAFAKLFTHRSDVRISSARTVPYLTYNFLEDEYLDRRDSRFVRSGVSPKPEDSETDSLDNAVFEQFMPTCAIVSPKNKVTRIYGESANYFHLPTGKFSDNLFEIVTDALKVPVSTILKEARDRREKVLYKDVVFKGEVETATINMTAMPVKKQAQIAGDLYALVFVEPSQHAQADKAEAYDIDSISARRITDLERELMEVHDKLNGSVAEQECVSEELQSANEELLTANEELQSSNEELQSVNEELYTVNTEYQEKVTELAGLNNDIANFLTSTLTGIIFVDDKLCVRRFTNYAAREFSMMTQDAGRPLKFFSHNFPDIDITGLCQRVLTTLAPEEHDVTTLAGKAYFMRIAPYRSTENVILGCVITFMDITSQKQSQVRLKDTEEMLSVARETVTAGSDMLLGMADAINSPVSEISDIVSRISSAPGVRELVGSELDNLARALNAMQKVTDEIPKSFGK